MKPAGSPQARRAVRRHGRSHAGSRACRWHLARWFAEGERRWVCWTVEWSWYPASVPASVGRERRRLWREGALVVLGDLDQVRLEALRRELDESGERTLAGYFDLTDEHTCATNRRTRRGRFGRIDGLVHVAALDTVLGGLLDDGSEEPSAHQRRQRRRDDAPHARGGTAVAGERRIDRDHQLRRRFPSAARTTSGSRTARRKER